MTSLGSNQGTDDSQRNVRDLVGGFLVNLVGRAGRIAKFSFAYVVSFVFGLEILGLYEWAWAIVSTLHKIAALGLHRGVVRFVVEARAAEDESGQERAIAAGLAISLAAGAAVTALGILASRWIPLFYDPAVGPTVRLMVLAVPFLNVTP